MCMFLFKENMKRFITDEGKNKNIMKILYSPKMFIFGETVITYKILFKNDNSKELIRITDNGGVSYAHIGESDSLQSLEYDAMNDFYSIIMILANRKLRTDSLNKIQAAINILNIIQDILSNYNVTRQLELQLHNISDAMIKYIKYNMQIEYEMTKWVNKIIYIHKGLKNPVSISNFQGALEEAIKLDKGICEKISEMLKNAAVFFEE